MTLKCLCKKYEFELDSDRSPLYNIIGETFGNLGNLINSVINLENDFAYEALYLICKVFYIANQLEMCPFLVENENLDPWI